MAQRQSIALVALLVLGLACIAMSADVRSLESGNATDEYVCGACKSLVAGLNNHLPGMKPMLLTLCGHIGSEKENEKCKEIVEAVSVEFETKSPEVNCQNMGFCKKA